MKKSIIIFVIFCGGVAGAIVYFHGQKTSPTSTPVESSLTQKTEETSPDKTVVQTQAPGNSGNVSDSKPIRVQTPPANEVKPDNAANNAANPVRKAVDALLSAKNAEEKHAVFQQLIKDGQLDAAMAELKQRMADNPNNPQLPTTLGEAMLNKLRVMHEAGNDDPNEMGILAMQADQSFNAALKIDPQNWEANFVKAASMYYWPADEKRDNDVVQRLSGLIDQQETMSPNPAFAQTYVVLGNEYQKVGQPEKAAATWQLGLQKFPNDTTLQKKIADMGK